MPNNFREFTLFKQSLYYLHEAVSKETIQTNGWHWGCWCYVLCAGCLMLNCPWEKQHRPEQLWRIPRENREIDLETRSFHCTYPHSNHTHSLTHSRPKISPLLSARKKRMIGWCALLCDCQCALFTLPRIKGAYTRCLALEQCLLCRWAIVGLTWVWRDLCARPLPLGLLGGLGRKTTFPLQWSVVGFIRNMADLCTQLTLRHVTQTPPELTTNLMSLWRLLLAVKAKWEFARSSEIPPSTNQPWMC